MDNFEQVRIYLPSLSCHYAHQLVPSNFSFYLDSWLYYTYTRRSLTNLHGWTTYTSHADSHAKTSQLIQKNECSIPYIICWTLVSQSFMQLTHGRERANWPQSRLILPSSLAVRSEPRAKKVCLFTFVDVGTLPHRICVSCNAWAFLLYKQ